MEELLPVPEPAEPEHDNLCRNCGKNESLKDEPNELCSECRIMFINYPIPKWIKLFAAVILLLMLAGLVRMPAYLSAALHLGKAEKFIEAKRYLSAERELTKVLAVFPDHLVANGEMLIASAYNWHLPQMQTAYLRIEGKQIDDHDLYSSMMSAMTYVNSTYPSDTTLYTRITAFKNYPGELKKIYGELEESNHADLVAGGYGVSNYLYELKDYGACDSILSMVLKKDPNNYPLMMLMTAVKRNLGEYDNALAFCDRMLSVNVEDVGAISQKVRVELKRKHDDRAAELAGQAMSLDADNIAAMEAQAMVDYYRGNQKESERLLASIRRSEIPTGDSTVSARLERIIKGVDLYR